MSDNKFNINNNMSKKYSKYYKANIIIFIDDQNTVKTVKNDIYRDYLEMQKKFQNSDARESILRSFYRDII